MNSSMQRWDTVDTIQICISLPPQVNSDGVWAKNPSLQLKNFSMPLLEVQMITIFSTTQVFHFVLSKFGMPKIVSEMLAGLVLGPQLLGPIQTYRENMFPVLSQDLIGVLASLGYTLFLFLGGVKMDLSMIFRTGRKAMCIGALTLLVPFLLAIGMQNVLVSVQSLSGEDRLKIIMAAAIQASTPFPVIACLLSDLNIVNSELGRLGLSTAVVCDLLSGFLVYGFSLAKVAYLDKSRAAKDIGMVVGYVIIVVFVARPAMFWMVRQTPEGRPVKDLYIFSIILVVLGVALASDRFDLSVVFGPFILGLAVPDGPPLGSTLVQKLDCMVSGVLLPLFVTITMMKANLSDINFNGNKLAKPNLIITIVIVIAKFAACMGPALYCKMPIKDATTLALIMSCKGVCEMAYYSIYKANQNITSEIFSLAMYTILVIAIIVPILISRLYDPSRKYAGYQRRNLVDQKPNTELKILACIQRPEHIPAIINLLENVSPTRESPLVVYALHLIELVGRASPVFISHQMQKKTLSNRSYSEDVILSFSHFQRNNPDSITVNAFTAISPSKLMYEDICMLALDKVTSLIVLPFHRKYSIDGSIELEDNTLRILNCSVIERAPCSVAILVNRGQIKRPTTPVLESYNVAMVFLGGSDDREAVTLAKRMAKDTNICLTVIRLIPEGEEGITDWDKMLDSEVLKDLKYSTFTGEEYVVYIEQMVSDGPETAMRLREIVDDYDLFIVGRSYNVESPLTTGFDEWSEFPELGVLGDMLASTDFNGRCSVLVVQQQMTV